jgi:hypothetical protein
VALCAQPFGWLTLVEVLLTLLLRNAGVQLQHRPERTRPDLQPFSHLRTKPLGRRRSWPSTALTKAGPGRGGAT